MITTIDKLGTIDAPFFSGFDQTDEQDCYINKSGLYTDVRYDGADYDVYFDIVDSEIKNMRVEKYNEDDNEFYPVPFESLPTSHQSEIMTVVNNFE